jgi:hypothetical protein
LALLLTGVACEKSTLASEKFAPKAILAVSSGELNCCFVYECTIRVFCPCTVIVLPNTGATPGQKIHPLRSFAQVLSLQLVQWSFAKRYLMNARLGFAMAVAVVINSVYHEAT